MERIFLHPPCHEQAAVEVSYSVLRRALSFVCDACGRFIAEIAVAEEWAGDAVPVERDA
jgi:hypothetical protein